MPETIATNDQAMREFQEKLIEKLRKDIAGMLPDAVLAQMVQRAIEDQFFKNIPAKYDQYNRETAAAKPSYFVQEAAKEAKPLIQQLVKEFVDNQQPEIRKVIQEYLEPHHLTIIVYAAIRAEMGFALQQVAQEMTQKLQKHGQEY